MVVWVAARFCGQSALSVLSSSGPISPPERDRRLGALSSTQKSGRLHNELDERRAPRMRKRGAQLRAAVSRLWPSCLALCVHLVSARLGRGAMSCEQQWVRTRPSVPASARAAWVPPARAGVRCGRGEGPHSHGPAWWARVPRFAVTHGPSRCRPPSRLIGECLGDHGAGSPIALFARDSAHRWLLALSSRSPRTLAPAKWSGRGERSTQPDADGLRATFSERRANLKRLCVPPALPRGAYQAGPAV